jgi:hypothetical protein
MRSAKKASPAFLQLDSLTPLKPLPPLTFPTLSELAGAVSQVVPEQKPKRLFDALLGDPKLLMHDLLDHPENYEEGLLELLIALVGGKSQAECTEDELALLDRAVMDFNHPQPALKKQIKVASTKTTSPPEQLDYTDEIEALEDPTDFPGDLQPHWWL